jgi:ATP-dependent DNA helicase RecQ
VSNVNGTPASNLEDTADRAVDVLQRVFGYDGYRGEQEAIIRSALAGEDALVLMPTGGGKSLCYQIPALVQPGMGIVVSPLIALMHDQVRALLELGARAACLNSTLAPAEQERVLCAAEQGEIDLLYVAPERILKEETLIRLQRCRTALIAIDEAHCVSSWGHDFRQDYLALGRLREAFPGVVRMALTATADERTRADIIARLELDSARLFITGFDRPNICYNVQPKIDARRQLLAFLESHQGDAGIVYCLSRKSVEATAEWLRSRGYTALPYHAGLASEDRASHQERFLMEDGVIVVATIAFGMGIDKPDVRFVAHLDLPKSIEAYYQETGRAGRDGMPADAWMVYGLQDVVRLARMVDESQADDEHKRIERTKLDALVGWCEVTSCRRRHLLAYFGEERLGDCGNCDVCLNPPVTWDGTEAARKALSCVYRTGQRFGAGHVIDVLRGRGNERVERLQHDALSTFGIGADTSEARWRSIFRQLVVRGYLEVDHARHGALRLTGSSRGLLRGEVQLALREDPEKPAPRKKRKDHELDGEDADLLADLKALRKSIADDQGIPPYVVFHDATLLDMVALKPENDREFLGVQGVGQAKLDKYGERFLGVIARR